MRDDDDTTTRRAAAGTLRPVRDALLHWFDRAAREFPWRRGPQARDPYRVLVAEVLLQQTQASRAAPAFERFIARFPDLQRLAAATSDEVLAAWQGLGYYRRALRLQRCAQVVLERHGGQLPGDLAALEALPGVGRYSARAISARAFGAPHIAVDANVRRVGVRVLDAASASDAEIERGLSALLLGAAPPPSDTAQRRGDVSEALIELGATCCTIRNPACSACPLAPACTARAAGRPDTVPVARPRAARRRERLVALVALRGDSVALLRRPAAGRWAGLWGFPSGDAPGRALPVFEHQLTHRIIEVAPRLVAPSALPADALWLPLTRVAAGGDQHPVAAVDQRLARRLLNSERPITAASASQPDDQPEGISR